MRLASWPILYNESVDWNNNFRHLAQHINGFGNVEKMGENMLRGLLHTIFAGSVSNLAKRVGWEYERRGCK